MILLIRRYTTAATSVNSRNDYLYCTLRILRRNPRLTNLRRLATQRMTFARVHPMFPP